MAYTGSVDLISGIRPKNNQTFPLVNAHDVYVDDNNRLDAKLNGIEADVQQVVTEEIATIKNSLGGPNFPQLTADNVKVNDEVMLDEVLEGINEIEQASVRVDIDQNFPDIQKARARSNIGAVELAADLTETGKAADAKVVGDEITELKDDLGEVIGTEIAIEYISTGNGYITSNGALDYTPGTEGSNNQMMVINNLSSYNLEPGKNLKMVLGFNEGTGGCVAFHNQNIDGRINNPLVIVPWISNDAIQTILCKIPEGATSVAIFNRKTNNSDPSVSRFSDGLITRIIELEDTVSEIIDSTLSEAGKAADAKVTGDEITRIDNMFVICPGGANIYDEENNSIIQSDPQYCVGIVYLYGYTGSIVISCDLNYVSYITDFHVYDSSDNDMGITLGSNIYNINKTRSGKAAIIPNGAKYLSFMYRTASSSGSLVQNVMVTEGSSVPETYEAYIKNVEIQDSNYVDNDYVKNKIDEKIKLDSIGINIYDVQNQSEIQIDPQYTVATIELNGYIGNLVVSCDSNKASYITDLHVYNSIGEDMGVSFGNVIYNTYHERSGMKVIVPSGAVKLDFKYRTYYSGGTLVKDVMVTKGDVVPDIYSPYIVGNVLIDSPYLTRNDGEVVAFVSLSGSDDNDGLTFETAVASFKKAFTIAPVVYAERGEYNQPIYLLDRRNVKLLPYDDGTEYSHTNPNVKKIAVKNGATFIHCDGLRIEDFIFESTTNSSLTIRNSNNVYLFNCEANNSNTSMGFDVINTNIVFDKCYATGNHIDGFNFHGYGTSFMNDCESVNNYDDGCSHHDGCIGYINGGKFNGNGKAGIAPAYGAQVDISNVICKDNTVHGIGYLSTNNGHANMVGTVVSCALIGNSNGLSVNSLCTVTVINCKYSGNSIDKNVTGTLIEY